MCILFVTKSLYILFDRGKLYFFLPPLFLLINLSLFFIILLKFFSFNIDLRAILFVFKFFKNIVFFNVINIFVKIV